MFGLTKVRTYILGILLLFSAGPYHAAEILPSFENPTQTIRFYARDVAHLKDISSSVDNDFIQISMDVSNKDGVEIFVDMLQMVMVSSIAAPWTKTVEIILLHGQQVQGRAWVPTRAVLLYIHGRMKETEFFRQWHTEDLIGKAEIHTGDSPVPKANEGAKDALSSSDLGLDESGGTNGDNSSFSGKQNGMLEGYLGCFRDQGDSRGTKGRDLDGKFVSDPSMTVEKCLKICSSEGYPYAGVEYGSQCFCGRSYGKFSKANNCDMHCNGNSSEICGGFWAIGVYSVPSHSAFTATGEESYTANAGGAANSGNVQDCKIVYKEYVKAYNRLTRLMSAGKDQSREAKDAYKRYLQKREAYEHCNKVEPHPSTQPKVIYNTAEGGEDFLNNERHHNGSSEASGGSTGGAINQTAVQTKLHFRDDFNRFDSRRWEVYEWQTLRRLSSAPVHNGVLDLRCDRTDRSAFVASRPIRLNKGDVVTIRRRVRAHYANEYFEGGIWFYQTATPGVHMPANRAAWLAAFGKNLFNVTYFHYYYEKPGVRQYVPAKNGFVIQGKNWRKERNYHVFPPLWDRWFVEEIVYDTASGTATYKINGQTASVKTLPFSGPYLRFIMHSYGWYTGHDVQVDWVDVTVRSRTKDNGMGSQILVDTADMFAGSGSVGSGGGISHNNYSDSSSCRALYRAYIVDSDRLVREITDRSVSQRRLIDTFHRYRDHLKRYMRCSGAKGGERNLLGSLPSESSARRCGVEYTHYRESYEELNHGLMRLDDLSFLRARQRYLRDKKAYEECLRHPQREIRGSVPAGKVAPKRTNGSNSHGDIAYAGTPVNNVLIALRARSQSEPDDSTITDIIPDGKTPFYLFVYYEGARPSDRLEVVWYLKKPGQKKQLLFDEIGGRFPASEGVIRGGPIQVEGGRFPAGKYRLLFKVNGKKAFEKFFRILR